MTRQLVLELTPPPTPVFENFVPGRNRAALETLRAVAMGESADEVIYVWGEPGSGRSHLLEAAVRAARAAGRAATLVRAGEGIPPVAASNDAALVAVDEADALDAAAQIAAFDLFNTLRARRAAFVATGSAPPHRIAVLEDLRTRLASGLVFELLALPEADKRATLRTHAIARGMALGDDVVEYLLTRLRRDLGTQLAVLDALDRYSLAQKRAVTLPLVREALDALALR